ncbi:MAG TPA: hypothetical protein PK736_07160 [Bacteroidia bacterium]|nr:hypothetical protein [Bacteroidia bacterium]
MSSEHFIFQGTPHEHPLNFKYSVIDINLDNGLGGIDSNYKSLILLNDTMVSGFTNACRHGNGRDWWVISPRFNSNAHKKFMLTPDSVYFSSSQNIGDTIRWRAGGQSCFRPDGTMYAIKDIISGINLFKFDRCTGMFYDSVFFQVPKLLGSYLDWTNGLAFSPSGRFLYVCQYTKIWQYDTWSSNIAASQIQVAEWDTVYNPFETYFFNMQLAPDKKIYISTWGTNYSLHTIENPDSLGMACNVNQNSVSLSFPNSSVPTFPNYDLGPLIGSPCDTLGLGVLQNNSMEQLEITVSPNPANSIANFVYHLPTNKQVTLTLYDGYGNIVARQSLYGVFRNFMFHTDKLANGLYYWVAQNGEVSASGKLVVVH